jgi:hypothetical protein
MGCSGFAGVVGVVQKIGFAQELQTLPKNYKEPQWLHEL